MTRPLSQKQLAAMLMFTHEWVSGSDICHINISTLMSLHKRGLLECRATQPFVPGVSQHYKSFCWDWRLKPVPKKPNARKMAMRFLQLPYHTRVEIALDLKFITRSDKYLPDALPDAVFRTAAKRKQVAELETAIDKAHREHATT